MTQNRKSAFSRTGKDAGFSLLELLVVITIIAVLSSTAVLGLRLGPGQSPSARMSDLARAIRYLQAEALYADRTFGLALTQDGWTVLEFDEPDGAWHQRAERTLHAAGDWGDDPQIDIDIEGRAVTLPQRLADDPTPDVFLLPGGEATPFRIRLVSARGERATCDVQLFGELTCDLSG